jgi:chromosome segregation ATPase
MAAAAVAAAEQTRWRPFVKTEPCHFETFSAESERGLETSKIEPADELEPAELDRQAARESSAAWVLDARRQTLAARAERAAAADKRIAELENELASAREELALRENENHSVQTSLELIAGENARLSRRLVESDSAAAQARSQLEPIKSALTAAEAERDKLAFAVDAANEQRRTEVAALNTRLEATASRAINAEKLLAEAWQSSHARAEETSVAERKVADATAACNAADKKLGLLENSLTMKQAQFRELEQSRSKLIEGMNTLLKAFKTRDKALARAEERIKLLSELFARLEAEANLAKSQKKIEELHCQLQGERMERTAAEGARKKMLANCAELERELDDYVRHSGKGSEQVQVRLIKTLLIDTVTF